MQEREVKLSAAERFDLPNLGGLVDGVTANPREDELFSTTYLDSDDYRLARSGLSFRLPCRSGLDGETPGEQSGALLVRDEIVFEGGVRQPPQEAVALVSGSLRRAELRPQVRLRTLRRGVRLHDGAGSARGGCRR